MRTPPPTPLPKSPLKLRLLRNSPTATITVGPTARWTLPTALLASQSPFFAAALKPNTLSESHTLTITLPEDDPEIFELFVQWLFASTFVNADPRNVWTEKAWVLGDKLGVTNFKDECMRALWREYSADNNVDSDESAGEVDGEDMRRCNIFPPTIAYVYENTPPGSKLRAFFTDMVAENMNVLDLNEDNGEGEMGWAELLERGGDFVVDLMKALKSGNLEGREIEVKVLADKVLEENDSGELE